MYWHYDKILVCIVPTIHGRKKIAQAATTPPAWSNQLVGGIDISKSEMENMKVCDQPKVEKKNYKNILEGHSTVVLLFYSFVERKKEKTYFYNESYVRFIFHKNHYFNCL